MNLGTDPQRAKYWHRDEQYENSCRKADIAVAVGIVDSVVENAVPHQKRKNGHARGEKEREKSRREATTSPCALTNWETQRRNNKLGNRCVWYTIWSCDRPGAM